MKAGLFDLVPDIAIAGVAHISKSASEVEFQLTVAGLTLVVEAGVDDVNGGTIAMAGVLGSIAVLLTQLLDIRLGSQHTGDDETRVATVVLLHQLPQVGKEIGSIGNQIRYTLRQAFYLVVSRIMQFYELVFPLLQVILAVNRLDAEFLGSHELNVIHVIEECTIALDVTLRLLVLHDEATMRTVAGILAVSIAAIPVVGDIMIDAHHTPISAIDTETEARQQQDYHDPSDHPATLARK